MSRSTLNAGYRDLKSLTDKSINTDNARIRVDFSICIFPSIELAFIYIEQYKAAWYV
jgi:hypothetical protein